MIVPRICVLCACARAHVPKSPTVHRVHSTVMLKRNQVHHAEFLAGPPQTRCATDRVDSIHDAHSPYCQVYRGFEPLPMSRRNSHGKFRRDIGMRAANALGCRLPNARPATTPNGGQSPLVVCHPDFQSCDLNSSGEQ